MKNNHDSDLPGPPPARRLTLAWKDLSVVARDKAGSKKCILQCTSGVIPGGTMVAIMGPSGAGKTTLLNALAGRLQSGSQRHGQVLLNGQARDVAYNSLVGYVQQQVLLQGHLTVLETATYAAQLRMMGSPAERAKAVQGLVQELGLWDARHTMVGTWFHGGLSSGQKRRLSIICEMVTQPAVLFLDEPTSGLDAAGSFYIMNYTKVLTQKGVTVAAVIHQPSPEVFELFDRLALLASGITIYSGEASAAESVFCAAGYDVPPKRSLADHFLFCTNRDFDVAGADACILSVQAAFADSVQYKMMLGALQFQLDQPQQLPDEHRQRMAPWRQTWVLTRRSMLTTVRNPWLFWVRGSMYITIALTLGSVFTNSTKEFYGGQDRGSMFFFALAFLTYQVIAAMPPLAEDLEISSSERRSGRYGLGSFLVSNTLVAIPLHLVIALFCVIPMLFISQSNHSADRIVYATLALFLSFMVVEGVALAMCAVMPHWMLGQLASAAYIGVMMFPAGRLRRINSLPGPVWRYPMSYLSWYTWSWQGLMRNEFDGTDGWKCSPDPRLLPGCTLTGAQYLRQELQVYMIDKWWMLAILAAMAVAYRLLFCAVCMLKERKALSWLSWDLCRVHHGSVSHGVQPSVQGLNPLYGDATTQDSIFVHMKEEVILGVDLRGASLWPKPPSPPTKPSQGRQGGPPKGPHSQLRIVVQSSLEGDREFRSWKT